MKKFTAEEIRDLLNQVYREEISFSRMVEILNERVSEAEDIPEGLKEGDLAIFWDNEKKIAIIKTYGRPDGGEEDYFQHRDQNGFRWRNAIKFESVEQFNRFIKGEI